MTKFYHVTGGYKTVTFQTQSYNEAFEEYLRRIKLTKPFTDAVIKIVCTETVSGNFWDTSVTTVHAVKLLKDLQE